MNDMQVPVSHQQAQEFFTAAELAELAKRLRYSEFPHSERGARDRAKANGWNDLPATLCRKRAGVRGGGGLEYHISLEPRLQGMLARERLLRAETGSRNDLAVRGAPLPQELPKRPQDTAAARGAIMLAIIGHAARCGRKRSQAIADFVEAQERHQTWRDMCAERDRGAYLTEAQLHMLDMGSPLARHHTEKLAHEIGRQGAGRTILAFGVSEALLGQANNRPRAGEFVRISGRTLTRWMKDYEAGGYSGLAPATTRASAPIPEDFPRFMMFYARPAKPALIRAHQKYLDATPPGIIPLTVNQVRYALREKLDHIERSKGREGALTRRVRMAYVSRDTSDLLPTTIYVADGHTFDAEVADPVSGRPMRPEITSIMDVATRKAVGWAISRKENVIAVTEALRNASVTHGICAMFYVDRGSGYKNKTFDDDGNGLMSRLDITKMHALPYNSQAKGNIERSHRTIWITLAKDFPTYLGADMDKEARQAVFRRSRQDLKLFGQSQLLMSWHDFRAAVARRAEEYNNEPHSALHRVLDERTGKRRFMTPNEAWDMHVRDGFEPVMIDHDMMDDLFRPYVRRTVSRCLIQWNTNEYFHEALNRFHKQDVFVGYDDAQADKVWVREIDRSTDEPGKLICVAVYAGNRVSYMPRSQVEAAMDRRQQGALKRIDNRRRDIEAERVAPYLLDHGSDPVADFIDLSPVSAPVETPANDVPRITPRRRPPLSSDEALAAWALAHPADVSPSQLAALRSIMSRPIGLENLRANGVDVEALRTLLRTNAA